MNTPSGHRRTVTSTKIVHASSAYPPALGGMEKVVQILARIQHEHNLNVSVITSNQDVPKPYPAELFPVLRLKSFVLASTTIMPTLPLKLLRLGKLDIVHLHTTRAYVPEIVWLISKVKGYVYIAHVHIDLPPTSLLGRFLLQPYKEIVLKRVLQAAAQVVVFTDDQKKVFHEKYNVPNDRIKVTPNGVEDKFYYNRKRSMHKKPRLLFVGRLDDQKKVHQLLHALDGISDQFETTLVGNGELELELKNLAKELKLENVTFAGRKDGEDLLDYYREADIFVLSSEREGMPLVLLEAMAMGLPIVATNVTGSRDVVKNQENGLLVPYNDTDAFRKALLQIVSDEKSYQQMSQTSRWMADQYSWEKIAVKFGKLYQEAGK